MYAKYFKRMIDFTLALIAIIVLSPLLVLLTIIGAIAMGGNPFFVQERSGKDEKIFKLLKFRTMSNKCDKDGKLLSDTKRLNKYGRFLRSTSCDELPSLVNILKGDLALVGPRPLLVEYLTFYTTEESKRHNLRPGLTGWAQVNGRNTTAWDVRLQQDVYYVENCSFILDCKILFMTILKVVRRSDILVGDEIKVGRLDDSRRKLVDEGNV